MAAVANKDRANPTNDGWNKVERFEEQRRYPRIDLDTQVAFRNGNGQHCVARLVNIAPDGIQIRCNVATAQILHPGGGKICPDNAPIVQTAISVPLKSGKATLSVCSRLTYLTTVDEEPKCIMGLRFVTPRPKAQKILDQYFSDQLHEFFKSDYSQSAAEPLSVAR